MGVVPVYDGYFSGDLMRTQPHSQPPPIIFEGPSGADFDVSREADTKSLPALRADSRSFTACHNCLRAAPSSALLDNFRCHRSGRLEDGLTETRWLREVFNRNLNRIERETSVVDDIHQALDDVSGFGRPAPR